MRSSKQAYHVFKGVAQGCSKSGGSPQMHMQSEHHIYTEAFLHLQTGAKQSVQRFKDAKSQFSAEIHDLTDRIPTLVREIWGKQSEVVVQALRQREHALQRLIRQWEDAEHRLIAVANSLTTLQTGQKLVAVGMPLAASQLLQRDPLTANCYTTSAFQKQHVSRAELSLQQMFTALNQILSTIAEEFAILFRGAFLFLLFLPVAVTSPTINLSSELRERWIRTLLWTLERAGPAFIKWGQWAATRPDLFSPDLCDALATLQTKAPSHSFDHSRRTIESAFGRPLDVLFAEFDTEPVASGSIAQVHRAVLTAEGARLAGLAPDVDAKRRNSGLFPLPFIRRKSKLARKREDSFVKGAAVAVKVRHPGAAVTMERDFALMQRGAALLSVLPFCGGPQLKESLMQFGAPLREQMDLRSEAQHLARFSENFSHWQSVAFPLPAAEPLVTCDVLVESFESGEHISNFITAPGKYNKQLAALGMNSYLQMLLKDNFIHADLHPGNILVRIEDKLDCNRLPGKIIKGFGLDIKVPRIVLLDVGMIAKLSGDDQQNLVDFFKSLTHLDGAALADSILNFAHELPPDPQGFKSAMTTLFDSLNPDHLRLHTQKIIGDMMDTIREHQVHLQGSVSTVVITTMVLEGWSVKLDPDIRIMETIKGILPGGWHQRLDRSMDEVMSSPALAMA